jgi:hypothetical protein
MPAAALALKEYLGGTLGCSISSSFVKRGDNEDSPTPLRNSKESSIQSSVGEAIPEPDHFTDESGEISTAITTEDAWDVFQQ